ncbi:MAG: hypothetical protein E7066_02610 [Lentimicrobiaceae bacterium]|nr:hypothetical protein [Lentimicrobiaceae bacterium]
MRLLNKIFIVISLVLLMACNNEPSIKHIDNLIDRLDDANKELLKVENDFDYLISEFKNKESVLRSMNLVVESQLLRAYLQQFEDERVVIKNDILFSNTQLNNLRDDFKDGLYDDETRKNYLDSEESAVKTIEAKLDYFSDRFANQREFLKTIDNQ